MSNSDFFVLVSAMFIARGVSANRAWVYAYIFLGIGLLQRWLA